MMDTRRSLGADLLGSPVRRSLMDALVDAAHDGRPDGMTAAELAEAAGLHVTTVRFHLDRLVASGLIETRLRRTPRAGRPSKVYAVDPGTFAAEGNEEAYRVLAELLANTLSEQTSGHPLTPEEAGAAWVRENLEKSDAPPASTPGQWMGKIGQMVDVLHEWGYTPEVSTSLGGRTAEIRLSHCPFIDMAKDNPALVCGIHRGLISGAMEQLGEDDTQVSLEPFVGPNLCTAHVTTRAPFDRTTTPPPSRRTP